MSSSPHSGVRVADWSQLGDRQPAHALVAGVDLVVVRHDDAVSVLYGRCLHRGALLADGHVDGEDLICGLHDWDYRLDSGVSAYNNSEKLKRFEAWRDGDEVFVNGDEVASWGNENPQPYDRDTYLGNYVDVHGTDDEPHTREIHQFARDGLSKTGHHGPVAAMGVPVPGLPSWDDIMVLPAQISRLPLLDDEDVGTQLVIGPNARKPLVLDIPLFVSDMSFGALSEEAKVALARGAERAGTGICSGEGGMLPEEQEANGRYFYELASAKFGFALEKVERVQAFHFKGGQAAKTGTGGHLPGHKVTGRIAEVRGLEEGKDAISPARFKDLVRSADFRRVAEEVRDVTGGIPIGFKLSANRIEDDIDVALESGVDYIILDGRGGGTGAAPTVLRDHISIPTLIAIPRARKHLDARRAEGVTLIATGGLRRPADFVKAMALGADGVALANSAIQAIGCQAMRACHTNNCPVGIATQKPHLRARLDVEKSAERLANWFGASVGLMKVLARAAGRSNLSDFTIGDLTTFDHDTARLTGVRFAGVG